MCVCDLDAHIYYQCNYFILVLGVLVLAFYFGTPPTHSGEVLNSSLDHICWRPACQVEVLVVAGLEWTHLDLRCGPKPVAELQLHWMDIWYLKQRTV